MASLILLCVRDFMSNVILIWQVEQYVDYISLKSKYRTVRSVSQFFVVCYIVSMLQLIIVLKNNNVSSLFVSDFVDLMISTRNHWMNVRCSLLERFHSFWANWTHFSKWTPKKRSKSVTKRPVEKSVQTGVKMNTFSTLNTWRLWIERIASVIWTPGRCIER